MATEEKPIVAEAPEAAVAPNLPTLKSTQVYSPTNVKQVLSGSNQSYQNMKLGDLEKKIAGANTTAEMNAINIKNQPVAMGVLTGQAAHQSALDTARLNSVSGLYNAKLLDQQRKEEQERYEQAQKDAERNQFIQLYGADPSQRPKGMSKREFAKAIGEGQFQELLNPAFAEDRAAAARTGSGGAGAVQSANIVGASNALQQAKGEDNYTNPYEYINQRDLYVANTPGATYDDFDSQFSGMLNPRDYPTVGFNPAQIDALSGMSAAEKKAQAAAAGDEQALIDIANASIPDLENKIEKIDSVTGRGVGAGITGWIERNIPSLFGARSDNRNIIESLIGQETLDTLTNLKAKGGTLGAISEKELSILQASASTIGAARKEDWFGRVYYDITEDAFKRELKRMKESTQRVLNAAKETAGSNNNDPLGLGI